MGRTQFLQNVLGSRNLGLVPQGVGACVVPEGTLLPLRVWWTQRET